MNKAEIKKRYTLIKQIGDGVKSRVGFVVQFKVGNQYFTVAETGEGREHAKWFQDRLADAIERLIAEAVVETLDELGVE